MNKRQLKKKITQRYRFGINHLSDYCGLPKRTIEKEAGEDVMELAKDINEYYNDFIPYLDTKAIDLMVKYGTGWAGSRTGFKTK